MYSDMNTKTIRLPDFWEEKLEESAERQGCSFSEVVRQRIKFGLSKIEYRQLETLAEKQETSETEVVQQGIKFMSIAMNPELSFADAIKSIPELAETISKKEKD